MNDTNKSFADLLDQSLLTTDLQVGSVIKARVEQIGKDVVVLSANLKTDPVLPISEFTNAEGKVEVKVGDEVEVVVESIEDGFGETRLSREKAKRSEAWKTLAEAYKNNSIVMGVITERVKGGFTVDVQSVRAFLPGSLVDVRPVRDPGLLEGKELEFKLIKMDKKRNNIVVSRRAVVEAESSAEREAFLSELEEGQVVTGVIKNITDYGAFVDLGGVDGLLHVTDMAWKRVKHPGDILHVGDEIKVKVLKFDREKNRVSLGVKQLGEDPWLNIARRYPVATRLFGKVTNITDYGCFVEIEDGIEGLVHMSEMDWTNKNIHPAKVVQLGAEVEVIVLEIDEERRRISLGIKQCQVNPWEDFATHHENGEHITGKIKSITDFGIFIGLTGGIDGLVHLSDLSWKEPGEEAVHHYKKGDEVTAVILGIDPERERISLGIKQLESDPYIDYNEANPKGTVITATITVVEQKRAEVKINDQIEGIIHIGEFSREHIEDLREHLKVGEEISAKVIGIDRKHHVMNLSIKELHSDSSSRHQQSEEPQSATTLGDLLKEQMRDQDED